MGVYGPAIFTVWRLCKCEHVVLVSFDCKVGHHVCGCSCYTSSTARQPAAMHHLLQLADWLVLAVNTCDVCSTASEHSRQRNCSLKLQVMCDAA